MSREGGLGKGLSSLIPQRKSNNNPALNKKTKKTNFASSDLDSEIVSKDLIRDGKDESSKNSILEIEVGQIKANPFQPRQYFDENKLEELATSIRKHGIIQPLVVTKNSVGGFDLVAGERRFKASQKNGLSTVPAIVKKISDKEKLEWALIENIQRHDLNAIEEAKAYQRLADNFNYTQVEIAQQVGKNRSTIANTLRLLDLSSNIKRKIRTGEISEGHGRVLLSLEDRNQRETMVNQIINSKLSVRETEKRVKKINNPNSVEKNSLNQTPEILEFEDKISQALGTKVSIKKGQKGGKFILNYYSEEEFGNLFNKLIS